MKFVLGLLICVSLIVFACIAENSHGESRSLLGSWEGRDEQGNVKLLLTIDTGSLTLENVQTGISTMHSYTLYEGARRTEMKIEGYEERFIVDVRGDKILRLDLSEADARKVSAPVISMVRFDRRTDR